MHVNNILERPDLQYQLERFFRRVDWSGGPTVCWPYKGKLGDKGYGEHFIGARQVAAHRTAYVLSFGALPDTWEGEPTWVLHRCDNPSCCNPLHLFLGNSDINVADMVAKNRQARGEQSGRSKLTDETASEILRSDEFAGVLAERYNVTASTIHNLRKRITWQHLAIEASPLQPRRGEKSPTAKLTDEQVLAIRADTRTRAAISRAYGICERHVSDIRKGRAWRHLLPDFKEV